VEGIRVLWGRCFEFERLLPYQPIADALRTVMLTLSATERTEFPAWVWKAVSQLVPENLTEDVVDAPLPDVTQYQVRLFGGVTHSCPVYRSMERF